MRRPQFFKISTLVLSYVVPVKSKVDISQNFVAYSEYMNFKTSDYCVLGILFCGLLRRFEVWAWCCWDIAFLSEIVAQIWLDPLRRFLRLLIFFFIKYYFDKSTLSCLFWPDGCFWPLTASMISEVKNNYAYVITQDICNKLIELGCMHKSVPAWLDLISSIWC
jgi:hypothetical protein